jgi:hypothetical protein
VTRWRPRRTASISVFREGLKPGGRIQRSKIHESMPIQVSLSARDEVDVEVLRLLHLAYDENC